MEGKGVRFPLSSVIMCVLILSLVVAQIQVEAFDVCCRTQQDRIFFSACLSLGGGSGDCLRHTQGNCTRKTGATCPPNYPIANTLENFEAINEYCRLGCVYSVCSSISTTFQNSAADVDEEVVKAVEHCNNACSEICTTGSNIIALGTAAA